MDFYEEDKKGGREGRREGEEERDLRNQRKRGKCSTTEAKVGQTLGMVPRA